MWMRRFGPRRQERAKRGLLDCRKAIEGREDQVEKHNETY